MKDNTRYKLEAWVWQFAILLWVFLVDPAFESDLSFLGILWGLIAIALLKGIFATRKLFKGDLTKLLLSLTGITTTALFLFFIADLDEHSFEENIQYLYFYAYFIFLRVVEFSMDRPKFIIAMIVIASVFIIYTTTMIFQGNFNSWWWIANITFLGSIAFHLFAYRFTKNKEKEQNKNKSSF